MITCRELIEFLDRYVGNELNPQQRRSFDFHLRLCKDCRNYLASYTQTIKLGQLAFSDGEDTPPADIPDQLVKAILASREK